MNTVISPAILSGEVAAPASKSMAHRALICAALADRATKIACSTSSVDIDATAECLNSLGAQIKRTEAGFFVEPIKAANENAILNCCESGSTLRFMLPVAAALGKGASLYGSGRLPERPIAQLCKAICSHGCETDSERLPLKIGGRLQAGEYEIDGSVSSQFISGLLLALPVTHAKSTVRILGEIQSRPYIEMTLQALRDFGIETKFEGSTIEIQENNGYFSPEKYTVEGDWSNGAFFICADIIGQNSVKCFGLTDDSVQGDKAVKQISRLLREKNTDLEIDVGDIPDLVPILAVASCFRNGKTRFYNAARLKIKESDRILSTVKMITDLGGNAQGDGDSLTVFANGELTGGTVDSFNDHRIVMAAAIAASACKNETKICGSQAINKSFPTFFTEYEKLGGKVWHQE